ncbi:MAG TPA: hypothetical protein VFV24_06945 [Candidatus Eisenbacteria bacterium]|nr:hypothetical protein [Candidatus Eisenbacteria bacterium]
MNAVKTFLALALVFSFLPSHASGCSCAWAGPFLRVSEQTDLIIRGTVVEYHRRVGDIWHAMDVHVEEVLRGRVTTKKIRIWGDNGIMCRPYVTQFPRNTEWIFAIHKNKVESKNDYVISGCGEYFLRVEDGVVTGAVTDSMGYGEMETLRLSDVKSLLESAGDRRKQAIPTEAPDIVGIVTSSEGRGLRVEVNPDEPAGSLKALVYVPAGALLVDRRGRVYDPWQVPVGSNVSAWFAGPVAESYPVQATARCVVLEDSDR